MDGYGNLGKRREVHLLGGLVGRRLAVALTLVSVAACTGLAAAPVARGARAMDYFPAVGVARTAPDDAMFAPPPRWVPADAVWETPLGPQAHPPRKIPSGWLGEGIEPASAPVWQDSPPNDFRRPVVPASASQPWSLQALPDGLIYRSYLAGAKEPRFAGQWVREGAEGWIWDIALGGRVGILRYGTRAADHPEGWQLDIEGAAFPRLDLEHGRELISADFRFGVPLTYGWGPYQAKFGYYHLSSHLGDEYMVRHQTLSRINYSRDVFVLGFSYYVVEDLRMYAEAGWASYSDGGSKPWEFQFGVDYSPVHPLASHPRRGSPFLAVNGHIREDVDFGGNVVVQTGWQWRGPSRHLLRMGMQYFTGMSEQFEFFNRFEDKLGFGLWYDY